MYKNGRLKSTSRTKLMRKLEKENCKGRILKKRVSGKSSKSKLTPIQQQQQDIPENNIVEKTAIETEANELPAEINNTNNNTNESLIIEENKELTMDDVSDTPPPQKLVNLRRATMDQNKEVNWISLTNYNQKEAENENILYSQLEKKSNERFRAGLDKQIVIKELAQQKEKQAIEAYKAKLNEQFESYAQKENEKKEELHLKTLALKKSRFEQVNELNRKRQYEMLKLRKHELKEKEKLTLALEKERLEKEEKKKLHMEKLKQMLEDNEKQKEIKLKAKEKEALETIKLQKQYAKMLEEQELARERKLKKIFEKQAKKFEALIEATSDDRAKEMADAKRAEEELRERERLEDEKDAKKKAMLKAQLEECKKSIAQQMIDKENREKRELEEDRKYGESVRKLAAEFEAEKLALKMDKLKKQREQALYLDTQIDLIEKRKQQERIEMSEAEKQMNYALLMQVKNNPNPEMKNISIDPKAPFHWKYTYRNAPF